MSADWTRILGDAHRAAGGGEAGMLAALDAVLERFDCATGTVHRHGEDGLLHLAVQRGIPEVILDRVRLIPIGKGMAGIAAERRAPVQVCNLQTDASGVAKPAARETKMEGSIAAPMFVESRLAGVLGVAKPVAYDFTPEEVADLMAAGEAMAKLGE